jgi:CRP-like cAMP-binding protein
VIAAIQTGSAMMGLGARPPDKTIPMPKKPFFEAGIARPAFDMEAFLGRFAHGVNHNKYLKNQKIFSQGEVASGVLFLQSGRVKMTVLSEQGKEAVVGIFTAGQFFGEACLNGEEVRTATSRALEECSITTISKPTMLAALQAEPDFAAFFITYLLSRNSRIEDDLIDQLFNSSERRLARLLLLLANFGNQDETGPIAITLSQETLAEMIGTTRSRVSFFMNKFRKKGFIDYNGKIEVHASLLDAVLREKPHIRGDE